MPGTPRRTAIATAVIELAAAAGARAVTHSAVDRHLGLPRGSTSYYYRTRADLIAAGTGLMQANSRMSFEQQDAGTGDAAPEIAAYVVSLLRQRRAEVRARFALLPELSGHPSSALFFSRTAARDLFERRGAPDPLLAAEGLIDLLEGLLLRFSWEPDAAGGGEQGSHESHSSGDPATRIHFAVSAYLAGTARGIQRTGLPGAQQGRPSLSPRDSGAARE